MVILKKQKQITNNVIVIKTKSRVRKLIRINYQKQFVLNNKLVGYTFVYRILYQAIETAIMYHLGRKLYYKSFSVRKLPLILYNYLVYILLYYICKTFPWSRGSG